MYLGIIRKIPELGSPIAWLKLKTCTSEIEVSESGGMACHLLYNC
jgi:hypothetical protein